MKFNTKTQYGIKAMLEIADSDDSTGVFQKNIAKNQGISVKYLDQIISALKAAGLIRNLAGKKSGYIIAKKAEEINLYDIFQAFESELGVIDGIKEEAIESSINNFWRNLNNTIINEFKNKTLSDLIEEQKKIEEKLNDFSFII